MALSNQGLVEGFSFDHVVNILSLVCSDLSYLLLSTCSLHLTETTMHYYMISTTRHPGRPTSLKSNVLRLSR